MGLCESIMKASVLGVSTVLDGHSHLHFKTKISSFISRIDIKGVGLDGQYLWKLFLLKPYRKSATRLLPSSCVAEGPWPFWLFCWTFRSTEILEGGRKLLLPFVFAPRALAASSQLAPCPVFQWALQPAALSQSCLWAPRFSCSAAAAPLRRGRACALRNSSSPHVSEKSSSYWWTVAKPCPWC